MKSASIRARSVGARFVAAREAWERKPESGAEVLTLRCVLTPKRGSRCPTSQLLRLALLALEQRRPKRGEEGA